MIDYPRTLKEARNFKYGAASWDKRTYQEGYCAYEVWERGRGIFAWQCLRKNGHGINGLYCKQHAKMIEKTHGKAKIPNT